MSIFASDLAVKIAAWLIACAVAMGVLWRMWL
jgi:hypothetical protein